MKLGLRPPQAREDVVRTDPRGKIRDVIPEERGVTDSHRPQTCVGNLAPVDRSMQHHCSGQGHYRLNCALGDSVLVMRADTSEAVDLGKLGQVLSEGFRREGSSVVTQVLLGHNTKVAAGKLEGFLGGKCLVRVQVLLEDDMDEARGVVHEDASASVQVGFA